MFHSLSKNLAKVTVSLTIFAASTLATIASAQNGDDEWRHSEPLLSSDVQALLDYQVRWSTPVGAGGFSDGPASFHRKAAPLWINILRADLKPDDHVFVQLISYERSCYRGECTNTQVLNQRDLDFAEDGRFTGELAPVTLRYQLNDGYAITSKTQYAAELVIWINGSLYKGADGRNLPVTLIH